MILKTLLILLLSISQLWAGTNPNFPGAGTGVLACGSTDDLLQENHAWTICAWVAYRSNGGGTNGRLVERDEGNGVDIYSAGSGQIEIDIPGTVTTFIRRSSTGQIPLTGNHFLCLSFDGTTTAANSHIYVDNVEVSYATTTNGNGLIDDSGEVMYIGNNLGANRSWDRIIHNMQGWDVVLSAGERTSVYNAGVQSYNMRTIQPTHLKMWHRFTNSADAQTFSGTYTDQMGNHNCTTSGSVLGAAPVYTNSVNSVLKNAVIK